MDIKKEFDVDYGEEFIVTTFEGRIFKFVEGEGLKDSMGEDASSVLQLLLFGGGKIEKLCLWKPKFQESYYIPMLNPPFYHKVTFFADSTDDSYYRNGYMCRTREDALELAKLLRKTARRFQNEKYKGI